MREKIAPSYKLLLWSRFIPLRHNKAHNLIITRYVKFMKGEGRNEKSAVSLAMQVESRKFDNTTTPRLRILLQRVISLLNPLTLPRHSKALPDRQVRLCLRHQRIRNILLAPHPPILIRRLAKWPKGHIATPAHEFPY